MRITFKTLLFIRGHSTIEPEHKDCGKSGSIMSLLEPHLGRGHTLYVDNWYTNPALFGILHKNPTNACGTVKKWGKGMPKVNEKLQKGAARFRKCANMLAIKCTIKKRFS